VLDPADHATSLEVAFFLKRRNRIVQSRCRLTTRWASTCPFAPWLTTTTQHAPPRCRRIQGPLLPRIRPRFLNQAVRRPSREPPFAELSMQSEFGKQSFSNSTSD